MVFIINIALCSIFFLAINLFPYIFLIKKANKPNLKEFHAKMCSPQDLVTILIVDYYGLVSNTYLQLIDKREVLLAFKNFLLNNDYTKEPTKFRAFARLLAIEYNKQYWKLKGIQLRETVCIGKLAEWIELEYNQRISNWIEDNVTKQYSESYINAYQDSDVVVPEVRALMFEFKMMIMELLHMTTHQCIFAGALPEPVNIACNELRSIDEVINYLNTMMKAHDKNYPDLDRKLQDIMFKAQEFN